jgi:hypothetical protein
MSILRSSATAEDGRRCKARTIMRNEAYFSYADVAHHSRCAFFNSLLTGIGSFIHQLYNRIIVKVVDNIQAGVGLLQPHHAVQIKPQGFA